MPQSQIVESTTVANLRDLGGIPLPGGRAVRPNLIFRSASLDRLDPAGDPLFTALGIRTVVDLRTARERAASPDRVPAGAHLIVEDVLADLDGDSVPARLATMLSDPHSAHRALGAGRAEGAMGACYRAFVTMESARRSYRGLLTAAARPEGGPLLFHCTAGKDRTGWGAALLLLLLGAEPGTVMAEYLAVETAVQTAFARAADTFTEAGGDPRIAEVVLGVRPAYLQTALDTLAEDWGDIETYARAGLGLKDETVGCLRDRLTV